MLNPTAIGLTHEGALDMVRGALKDVITSGTKDIVEIQIQIDTGYVAIALKTRWRKRSIFSAQRTGGLGELTYEDSVIICVNEEKVPFLKKGGQWDDIGWEDLHEFSWGMFLKFMDNLLIEIHYQLSKFRDKAQTEKGFTDLQTNMIFNLIFIGDPMWIPKEFNNIISVGKTSEFYS